VPLRFVTLPFALFGDACLRFSVDLGAAGQVLASASNDRTFKLWDARTGQELRALRGHTNSVASVAFAEDGKTLWSHDNGGVVLAWEVDTGECLKEAASKRC
jgi:WD40 repeat protein